jgi:FkbM family methyltransferase
MRPTSYVVARTCRFLPPLFARKVSRKICPTTQGRVDDLDFQVRAQTGSLFLGNTSDSLGHGFSLVGYNEWRLWAVARALSSPGDTIVEVGANIGTETVGFSDIVGSAGRVVAFEPLASSVATLERALSHARHRNVEVLPYAVGARAESIRMAVPAGFPSRAQVVTEEEEEGSTVTVEAESVTLDSMEDMLGRVRLLFVDAEGSEVNVIRGADSVLSRSKPDIVIEANPKSLEELGFTAAELRAELVGHGYEIAKLERLRVSPVTETEFSGYQNWVCVQDVRQLEKLERFMRVCAVAPNIPLLHPLRRAGAR